MRIPREVSLTGLSPDCDGTLISDSSLWNCEQYISVLKATQSLVLCYIILTRLRQVTKDCGFYTAHSLSISRSLSFARLTEARCLVASCTVERLTRHDDPNNPRGTESGWQARVRTRRRGLPPQSRDDCSLVWDAEQEAPATPHLDPWPTEDATAPHLLF